MGADTGIHCPLPKAIAECSFDGSAFPIPPPRLRASARVLPLPIRSAALGPPTDSQPGDLKSAVYMEYQPR